jgi:hypothetical protein
LNNRSSYFIELNAAGEPFGRPAAAVSLAFNQVESTTYIFREALACPMFCTSGLLV